MSFFVNTMVCGFSLYQILAFFLIYSCLGWCLEVIYAAVSTGQLVNRGFLNGPVCPIYGFGMIIVLFTLSPLADNLLLLYIGGVILPSVLELAGGWALYKLYHTRWWDYSDFPFNIGGYICLEFSLLWGVGTVVVMKAVHPVIAGLVEMVPQMVGFVLMCILYACYAADVVVTAFAASDLARELDALEKVADSMHAVSDAMTELLGTTAMCGDHGSVFCFIKLNTKVVEPFDRIRCFHYQSFYKLRFCGKMSSSKAVQIMLYRGIIFFICCLDPTFCHHGVGITDTELCNDHYVSTCVVSLDGTGRACTATADDQYIYIIIDFCKIHFFVEQTAF